MCGGMIPVEEINKPIDGIETRWHGERHKPDCLWTKRASHVCKMGTFTVGEKGRNIKEIEAILSQICIRWAHFPIRIRANWVAKAYLTATILEYGMNEEAREELEKSRPFPFPYKSKYGMGKDCTVPVVLDDSLGDEEFVIDTMAVTTQ